MINLLCNAQQSLVSTSSTITLKQQHCKKRTQHVHRPQHKNSYWVRRAKTTKQAHRQTHGQTNNRHIRHPRRPGRSGGERGQTSKWGGKHGHLALIFDEAKYRLITATTTNSVDRQVKPAGTNPNIDGKTSNFERIKLSRAQDEKIREFHLQEEIDEQPKEKTIEAISANLKKTTWGTVTKLQSRS